MLFDVYNRLVSEVEDGTDPVLVVEDGKAPVLDVEDGTAPVLDVEDGTAPLLDVEDGTAPGIYEWYLYLIHMDLCAPYTHRNIPCTQFY